MKPNGMRCLAALLLAMLLALSLMPEALAGRMIYDGEEAMKEGVLYPYSVSESACLIDAAGNVYAEDGYYSITTVISNSGLRRFIAIRIEGEEMRSYLLDERGNPLTDGACEYIDLQDDDLIFSRSDGLQGAYGWNGEILVEPEYMTLCAVGDGSYLALRNDRWEIKDGQAERLWPGRNPESVILGDGNVTYLGFFHGGVAEASVYDGEDTLCGLIDAEGKWRVPPVYSYVYSAGSEYYIACQDGKSGMLDSDGRIVLPIIYDEITTGSDAAELKCLVAELDGVATVDDVRTMEKLFDVRDMDYYWFDNFCTSLNVRNTDGETMRIYGLDGRLISQSDSNRADVTTLTGDRFLTCDYDTYEYSLTDSQGHVLLSGIGMPYCVAGEDGVCALTVYTSRVVDTEYGYAMLDWHQGRYGLYDLDGHEILPPKYDSIRQVCQGLYAVIRGPWYGVVNARGEWILRRSAYTTLMD